MSRIRFLSLVLTVCMLLTMLPAWALAEVQQPAEGRIVYEDAQPSQAEQPAGQEAPDSQDVPPESDPAASAEPADTPAADGYKRDADGKVIIEVDRSEAGGMSLFDKAGKRVDEAGFDLVAGAVLTVRAALTGGEKKAYVKARVSIADPENPDVNIVQKTLNKASTKGKTDFKFKAKELKALEAGKTYKVYLQTGSTKNIASLPKVEIFQFKINTKGQTKQAEAETEAPKPRRETDEQAILDSLAKVQSRDLRTVLGVKNGTVTPVGDDLRVSFTLTEGVPGSSDLPKLTLRVENSVGRSLITQDITPSVGSFNSAGELSMSTMIAGTDLQTLLVGQIYTVVLDVLADTHYQAKSGTVLGVFTTDGVTVYPVPQAGTFSIPSVYTQGEPFMLNYEGNPSSAVERVDIAFTVSQGSGMVVFEMLSNFDLIADGAHTLDTIRDTLETSAPGEYTLEYTIFAESGEYEGTGGIIGDFELVASRRSITITGSDEKTVDLTGSDTGDFSVLITADPAPFTGSIDVHVYVDEQQLSVPQTIADGGDVVIPQAFIQAMARGNYGVYVEFDGNTDYAPVGKTRIGTLKVESGLVNQFTATIGSAGYCWTNGASGNLEPEFTLSYTGTDTPPTSIAGTASIRNASNTVLVQKDVTFSLSGTPLADTQTITFTPNDLYNLPDGSYDIWLAVPMAGINDKLASLTINDGLAFAGTVPQNLTYIKGATNTLSLNVKLEDGLAEDVPFTIYVGNTTPPITANGTAKGDGSDGGKTVTITLTTAQKTALDALTAGNKLKITLTTSSATTHNITDLEIGELTVVGAIGFTASTQTISWTRGATAMSPAAITLAFTGAPDISKDMNVELGLFATAAATAPLANTSIIKLSGKPGADGKLNLTMPVTETELNRLESGSYVLKLLSASNGIQAATPLPLQAATLTITSNFRYNNGVSANISNALSWVKGTTTAPAALNVGFLGGSGQNVTATLTFMSGTTIASTDKSFTFAGLNSQTFNKLSLTAAQMNEVPAGSYTLMLSTAKTNYDQAIAAIKIGTATVTGAGIKYAGATDIALTFVKGVNTANVPITIKLSGGQGTRVSGVLTIGSTNFPVNYNTASPTTSGFNPNGDTSLSFAASDIAKFANGTYDIKLATSANADNAAIAQLKIGTLTVESVPEITSWANNTLPGGTVGSSYLNGGNAVVVRVTAAPAITSASVSKGTLPNGLKLSVNSDGNMVISGKPTKAGKSTFTLKATNKHGSATQEFSITVASTSSGGSGGSSGSSSSTDESTSGTSAASGDLVSLGTFQTLGPATLEWMLAQQPLMGREFLLYLVNQQSSDNVAYPLAWDENLDQPLSMPIVGAGQYLLGRSVFEPAAQGSDTGFLWTVEAEDSSIDMSGLRLHTGADFQELTDTSGITEDDYYHPGDFIPVSGLILVQLAGTVSYDASELQQVSVDPDVNSMIEEWKSR